MSIRKFLLPAATSAVVAVPVSMARAQSWDMPTAYAPSSFHTINIERFAAGVKAPASGKLLLKVYSGASLYKMQRPISIEWLIRKSSG